LEDVVEKIERSDLLIQNVNLKDLYNGDPRKILDLQIDKDKSLSKSQLYKNKNNSILYGTRLQTPGTLQIIDLVDVEVILGDFQLSKMDIHTFKDKYPGSYSLRNFYGKFDLSHFIMSDSVKRVDHVFLLTVENKENPSSMNGRLDISWINGKPYQLYFIPFP
jgi:hypothetical protein